MQDQHISNVTRRALDDNNQLQLEIAFQTKQTKDLLEQNGTYTRSAIQLRRCVCAPLPPRVNAIHISHCYASPHARLKCR